MVKQVEKMLETLMKHFELSPDCEVSITEYDNSDGSNEECIDVQITGDDLGILIGYMGKNLRSLQRVLTLMLNKSIDDKSEDREFVRIVVDVSGYRKGRIEHLENLAKNIRDEVLASNDLVDLSPMTSFERRVIHVCLSDFDDVTTESFGEGRSRCVRVSPSKGEAPSSGDENKEEEKSD